MQYQLFWVGTSIVYILLISLSKLIQGYFVFPNKPEFSIKDLTGKTAIITGGNSGIGLSTAIHLSQLNANVIIACRNQARAEKAIKDIRQQSNAASGTVRYMILDLADLASIKQFATDIHNADDIDIDYLVLNAGMGGVLSTDFGSNGITKDGLQDMFQVNYFGHWCLSKLLLQKVKQTANKRCATSASTYGAPVRIVSVSSMAHMTGTFYANETEWNNLAKGKCVYSQTKVFNIMHMRKLQQRLIKDGYEGKIQCCSIRPGLVRTNIFNNALRWNWKSSSFIFTFGLLMTYIICYPFYRFWAKNAMIGAYSIVHCICSNKIVNGGFYNNCALAQTSGTDNCSNKEHLWDDLWTKTNHLLHTFDIQ
eukprot:278100_1